MNLGLEKSRTLNVGLKIKINLISFMIIQDYKL